MYIILWCYVKKRGFVHIGNDIKAIMDELEKGNLIGTEILGYYKKDNNRIPINQEIIKLVETYCF